jgi:hypothetical protein
MQSAEPFGSSGHETQALRISCFYSTLLETCSMRSSHTRSGLMTVARYVMTRASVVPSESIT